MKQHEPWFDEECLGVLDQRKQAKMQLIIAIWNKEEMPGE